ncbi:MAG: hypothetical protein M1837_005246 [Sclerophora amabilis]|nr:MAG: hypothetical protein M1837_005246 [Sclerophora amabilis]
MSGGSGRRFQFVTDIILVAAVPISAYYAFQWFLSRLDRLDPEANDKREAQKRSAAILRRLDRDALPNEMHLENAESKRPRKEDLELSRYEHTIATEVVAPEDIPVSFDDIGGLTDIIEELKESVIYPLTLPHLYSHTSPLLSAPSGVLLYGPPGCGKTMLAKALAHESGACFINLHISTVTEKWYGDSNKMVSAVFSLARKLQPSIVFIDEIDAVLGTRRSGEHEASSMVKAECVFLSYLWLTLMTDHLSRFMTHWDGLTSANTSGQSERILILGATNRIQDIDEAILRRMPKKFPVSLPSASQRRRILSLILRDTKIDSAKFDIDFLIKVMAGLSGSDIKEACRDAAMVPVREFIRAKKASGERMDGINPAEVRGVRTEDFFKGAASVQAAAGKPGQGKRANIDEKDSSDSEYEDTGEVVD